MKYGVLFCSLSLLVAYYGYASGGWFLLLLWPAVSFGVVRFGYLAIGPRVFGKKSDGSMRLTSIAVLLPFLLYLWGVWHLVRLLSREPAYNCVVDGVLIGRRLLSRELPTDVQTVVDLTSEFSEPLALRCVRGYLAVPMLDASVLPPGVLAELAFELATASQAGPIFIHCAQGHGRTGLMSALVLIARRDAEDVESALALVQSSRPLVRLNRDQRRALTAAAAALVAVRR